MGRRYHLHKRKSAVNPPPLGALSVYWSVTVTRLAEDRSAQLSDDDADDELIRRVRKEAATRADFAKVHACVTSADVPDEREVRLVLLGPEHPHAAKDAASPARRVVPRAHAVASNARPKGRWK